MSKVTSKTLHGKPPQEFNCAIAEAAGALKCLLGYVRNLRAGAVERGGLPIPTMGAESPTHAAEE